MSLDIQTTAAAVPHRMKPRNYDTLL